MLKPLLDTIRHANVESISARKYECRSCGRLEHMDEGNFRTWRSRDTGERHEAYVCDWCLSHGWDEWGR